MVLLRSVADSESLVIGDDYVPLDDLRNRNPGAKWRVHSASIVTMACDEDSESLIIGADFVPLDDLRNRDLDAQWLVHSASIVTTACNMVLKA